MKNRVWPVSVPETTRIPAALSWIALRTTRAKVLQARSMPDGFIFSADLPSTPECVAANRCLAAAGLPGTGNAGRPPSNPGGLPLLPACSLPRDN